MPPSASTSASPILAQHMPDRAGGDLAACDVDALVRLGVRPQPDAARVSPCACIAAMLRSSASRSSTSTGVFSAAREPCWPIRCAWSSTIVHQVNSSDEVRVEELAVGVGGAAHLAVALRHRVQRIDVGAAQACGAWPSAAARRARGRSPRRRRTAPRHGILAYWCIEIDATGPAFIGLIQMSSAATTRNSNGKETGRRFLRIQPTTSSSVSRPGGARHLILHLLEPDRAVGREDRVRRPAPAARSCRSRIISRWSVGTSGGHRRADVEQTAERGLLHVGGRRRRIAWVARVERLEDDAVGMREEPELDVALAARPARRTARAPRPTAASRSARCRWKAGTTAISISVAMPNMPSDSRCAWNRSGLAVGSHQRAVAVRADQPEAAREGREVAELAPGAVRAGRHRAGERLRVDVALVGERQPLVPQRRGQPLDAPAGRDRATVWRSAATVERRPPCPSRLTIRSSLSHSGMNECPAPVARTVRA